MKDRKPGAPGRYSAVISAAERQKMQNSEQFYITLMRDDLPVIEGTPYSKAAVLPDSLAANICPDVADPTPADALWGLLPRRGGTMSGAIDMGGNKITNLPAPMGWGDAANKGFLTDHGVCGEGAYISDCNKAFESGFYKWDVGCANSPFDYATMFVSGRYGDSCNQIAICNAGSDRGKIVARAVDSSGASPWVPLDGSNSAPAGYGWGEYPFYPEGTNIDNIPHKNCAVRMDGNPLPGVWIGHYTTVDHMSGYLRMVAMNGQYKGCVITRTRIVYVWDEWEWEVPPLDAPLIENKTTERYNSQAVYQLRVEMGVLATEFVEVAHGATFSKIVEINAIAVDESRNVSFPIAYTANDNVQDMGVYVDGTNVTIHNPQLLNAYKATVILKYVK